MQLIEIPTNVATCQAKYTLSERIDIRSNLGPKKQKPNNSLTFGIAAFPHN